jgi:hypothetical protein
VVGEFPKITRQWESDRGRDWVVYQSIDSAGSEIYVRPFAPDASGSAGKQPAEVLRSGALNATADWQGQFGNAPIGKAESRQGFENRVKWIRFTRASLHHPEVHSRLSDTSWRYA